MVKPNKFRYHEPGTVDDAVGLLADFGDEAKLLAGGQSLVPIMSLRLTSLGHLIDVNGVAGLDGIERDGDAVRIGAIVRQAVAEHDGTIGEAVPLLSKALPNIGHFQIRNRGTVGGSIAHADPASELPAVALALDATIEASSTSGSRLIPASDFFTGTWQTTLADGEMLTGVRFPVWPTGSGFAVKEVARRHGDFALCGAVAGVQIADGRIAKAAIALFGVAATPVRAAAAEAALIASGPDADLTEIGHEATRSLSPSTDIHATGQYRAQVAAVMVRRAIRDAIEEARS